MTLRSPLIVASLPGRSVEEARVQAAISREGGADIAEVRLDRWSEAARSHLGELFPSPIPLLATLRSTAEGGDGPDAPEARREILTAAARLPFRFIDLEEARDGALMDDLPPSSALGRIISTHFPEGTSTRELAGRLRKNYGPGTIRKVVLPASVGTLLREILPILPRDEGPRIVVQTTGASGALLRAWSRSFGFPIVYASMPRNTGGTAYAPVEAAQVPADRLRRYFDGGEEAPLFAVTGHPIAHSLSPYLHSRWMRTEGRAGLYLALDISTETEFLESLAPLATGGFRGLSVAHPWKGAALEAATSVAPGAEKCGAANCLSFRGAEIDAENTDLVAVLRRLEDFVREARWDGRELVVVGAGGAAAATLAAAHELGASAHVFARRKDRAIALAARFDATPLYRAEARVFSLVVHATAYGQQSSESLDAPLAQLVGAGTQVLDWVYAPVENAVRETAERGGGHYEDGWRLLAYQAAASFGIWWGTEPDADELAATISEGPCTA